MLSATQKERSDTEINSEGVNMYSCNNKNF